MTSDQAAHELETLSDTQGFRQLLEAVQNGTLQREPKKKKWSFACCHLDHVATMSKLGELPLTQGHHLEHFFGSSFAELDMRTIIS